MNRIFPIIIVIAAVMLAVWFVIVHSQPMSSTQTRGALLAHVAYACDAGKTIDASYYDGTSTPATASQPPVPGGSVTITLSDGRTTTLRQTISADGTRYANGDESFVFWSKGNGAFVTENNQQTYTNCVDTTTVAANPVSQSYTNTTRGFTLQLPNVNAANAAQYPDAYAVDESYSYQALGPNKSIAGVKFTIPGTMATGTNLSTDSYISVEQLPNISGASCVATLFTMPGAKARTVTENGTTYSVASTTDAAAGNRYDETVYAIPGSSPCTAMRYFVHYGAFGNYPAGSVKQFNEAALVSGFDAIRHTLVLSH